MIRGYSDHAANERTFLAWVRTGIAVIAFGFVVEKFNLFVLTIAGAVSPAAGQQLRVDRFHGPLGRYDGLALIVLGAAIIVAAAVRFARTGRMLDDSRMHAGGTLRAELILSIAMALVIAVFSAYIVLG
ncbi:MAG: YidH family protein [Stellaceae bacterium]